MRLEAARLLAEFEMTRHGLGHWSFEFDDARARFGVCRHWCKTISLSRVLVELNTETKVRDVVLHEIAHALVGANEGHGPRWKAKALEVGCSATRTYDDARVEPAVVPQKLWEGSCRLGLHGVIARRESLDRSWSTRVHCRKCMAGQGGVMDDVTRLVWRKTR